MSWRKKVDRLERDIHKQLTRRGKEEVPIPKNPVEFFEDVLRIKPYKYQAEFTITPDKASIGNLVKFDASGSLPGWNGTHEMPILEYRWDFGDDNKTTTSTPIVYHRFGQPGIYYVALTVYARGATPETDSTTWKATIVPAVVGGYPIQIKARVLTPYLILTAILAIAFTAIKRKTTRKKRNHNKNLPYKDTNRFY